MSKSLYGATWADDATDLQIEFSCIRLGGRWTDAEGYTCGKGLQFHYHRAWELLWPTHDWHRWAELGLKRLVENDITVFMGPGDSNKTFLISKFVLCDWWVAPRKTLWMCSSTDKRGAELRIWGKIKQLFNEAREIHPWLVGYVLDSKGCIVADKISDDQTEARVLTQGIIFIPCKQGNTWLGLGPYAGIKPPEGGRLGHAGDECSLMHPSFLDAYANWYGKENFRGILTGNPGDLEDPLCRAAEPKDGGWEKWKDTGKTQEWRSSFYGAWVVAFDGRDSPNFDHPMPGGRVKYRYLVGPKKLEAVKAKYGENDWHWWNQCVGKPSSLSQERRVITRQLVMAKGATRDVIWESTDRLTWVAALDAAYGGVGGDRCVIRRGAFGRDVEGNDVILSLPPEMVPVSVKNPDPAEDQIATFCKAYCMMHKIPPNRFFFDGRSQLAIILARIWSPEVNVLDFGGTASERPVPDEWVINPQTGDKRPKLSKEHYYNFVTELWFSVYYLTHSRQLCGLDEETAREGYQRSWKMTGNRIQVEPKKEMKERTTHSPDYFDALVTMVEGCRRLGFQMAMIASMMRKENKQPFDAYLKKELASHREFLKKSSLTYA